MIDSPRVTWSRRLADLAREAPDRPALVFLPAEGPPVRFERRALDAWVSRLARWLQRAGAGPGRWVALGLPNGPLHVALALAAWRAGAGVVPIAHRATPGEAARLLGLLDPAVTVAPWGVDHPSLVHPDAAAAAEQESDAPLDERVPHPAKAVASGGSTGAPKVIVDPAPWLERPGGIIARYGAALGVRSDLIQLVAGPLYHNAPFLWTHYGLFEGHVVVLLERFTAGAALDAIQTHRAEWTCLVPTMMQRMLVEQRSRPRDLSSLVGVYHTAAPCPAWVKQGWIDLIGAERVFEAYGSTEGIGACVVRGDEWLRHPGTVGRPMGCRVAVRDDQGRELPPGAVGELYFRLDADEPPFRYLGADPRTAPDGFASVGDLGWVNAEGYVFLADRRTDLIITGGVNVYPAEVEAVVSEHPAVRDVAVVGLRDPDWGRRVHAVVEPADPTAPPTAAELDAWCRERLSPPRVPKSFEIVAALPRNEAGKIRRTALVAERGG